MQREVGHRKKNVAENETKILPKVSPVLRSPKVLLQLHTHYLHTHRGSVLLMSSWCSHDLHLASGINLPTAILHHLSPQASKQQERQK